MYMNSMNLPPKKPPRGRRLIQAAYVLAAAVAVLMALVGAFTMNSPFLSLCSFVYGVALIAAVLYKMAKERAEEPLFVIRTVLYGLLLLAAVFVWIITWIMPADTLAARIVPMLLVVPDAAISIWQLRRNIPFL